MAFLHDRRTGTQLGFHADGQCSTEHLREGRGPGTALRPLSVNRRSCSSGYRLTYPHLHHQAAWRWGDGGTVVRAGVRREISTASGQSFSIALCLRQPAVWLILALLARPICLSRYYPMPARAGVLVHTVLPVQPLVCIAASRFEKARRAVSLLMILRRLPFLQPATDPSGVRVAHCWRDGAKHRRAPLTVVSVSSWDSMSHGIAPCMAKPQSLRS